MDRKSTVNQKNLFLWRAWLLAALFAIATIVLSPAPARAQGLSQAACVDQINGCSIELCNRMPGRFLSRCKKTCDNCNGDKIFDSQNLTTAACQNYARRGYCKTNHVLCDYCPLTCREEAGVDCSIFFNQPPIVANRVPDLLATEGQSLSFTVPANSFKDPNGNRLTFSISGLPAGLTFNANTLQIGGTLASGTGGKKYTVTLTADNGHGGTTSTSFKLTVNKSAAVSVTVNVDASKNYSKSKAAVVTLPAGEYRVHVIGKAEGGLFDAGSVTSSTKGCRADGTKCKYGWEHNYRIRPGNKYIKVTGTGKYETAYLALSNAPSDASFILGSESEVKFYIYNPSSPRNNRGGVSLKVEKLD